MNELKIEVKKPYNGMVDIRSKYIDVAFLENRPIRVYCTAFEGANSALYTIEDLLNDEIRRKDKDGNDLPRQKFIGPVTGEEYWLYKYKWK